MRVKVYYRTIQTTAPLRDQLHNEAVWTWTPAQAQAFLQLKQLVATTTVLAYYSQRARTIVSMDASSHGVGAVLLQIQEKGRRAPIMYSFRALTATEQKNSQIEKEALAMVWVCEKFHCYFFETEMPFMVETDKPLLAIMNTQSMVECPPRLMRL